MSYMDLFDSDDREMADKALDYLDGDSKEHLIKFLQAYRKNALRKGMVPRARNLTKMVIQKSGMLFSGRAPTINVYPSAQAVVADPTQSLALQTIFESANWVEFFTNFDEVVRLLKTGYVLVQYSPEKDKWVFEALDQSNCAVQMDKFGDMTTLIYATGKDGEYHTYRAWTPLETFDVYVDQHGNEEVRNVIPNPYGIIPACPFHDTNVPREGAWNEIPEDLIEINDIYNLHLTDSEFASMWNKQPTLFTNAKIQGGTSEQYVETQVFGEALPRWTPSGEPGFVGGPGTVVGIDSQGETVYLEYKKPEVSLMPLDDMVSKWVADFAGDWSVNIKLDGQGSKADSGFKLVVEEMPNLELRKHRQRMFEAGFKRLYEVIKVIANFHGWAFTEDSVLFVTFGKPELPIDEKLSEEVWSRRIAEKRASRLDYFMEAKGMSREEALAKIAEIDAEAPITPNRAGAPVTTTVTV